MGEHACRSVISINLQNNFIEITFRYGFSPVNLLHIFRTPFYKNTSDGLLLCITLEITKTYVWLFQVFWRSPETVLKWKAFIRMSLQKNVKKKNKKRSLKGLWFVSPLLIYICTQHIQIMKLFGANGPFQRSNGNFKQFFNYFLIFKHSRSKCKYFDIRELAKRDYQWYPMYSWMKRNEIL